MAILLVLAAFGLPSAYLVLLAHPGAFFRYSFTRGAITLHSDEPIPPDAAGRVLEDVDRRLARTSLFRPRPGRGIHIYICNRQWRFSLFANIRSHVAGLAYVPWTDRIYLRADDLDAGRLIGPSGKPVPGGRTLAYFIAHEIMHTLNAEDLGAVDYLRLPRWKDEGYADYIARGADFSYGRAIDQLRRGDREMDPRGSGLYLRYHLLVAHLLDRERIGPREMLAGSYGPGTPRSDNARRPPGSDEPVTNRGARTAGDLLAADRPAGTAGVEG